MGTLTPFDPDRILDALHENEVRFVVIGGLAAIAQNAGWPTLDVDIVVATDADNMTALLAALGELAAEYDTLHWPPIRPDLARLTTLTGPQLFRTRHGRPTYSRKPEVRPTNHSSPSRWRWSRAGGSFAARA